MHRFENLGVIKNELNFDETKLDFFTSEIIRIQKQNSWNRNEIISLFHEMIPDFNYKDKGKYLESKM